MEKEKFMYPKADILRRYFALFMHLGSILNVPGFVDKNSKDEWRNTPIIFSFLTPHLFKDNRKLYRELDAKKYHDLGKCVFKSLYGKDDLLHLFRCCIYCLDDYDIHISWHLEEETEKIKVCYDDFKDTDDLPF